MSEWIDVCKADELSVGARKVVHAEVGPVVVFNLDGEFYAIEDVCSHDGGELASGPCDEGQIICPRHGARFCIRTGKVLTPPAYEDIESFPVRVEAGLIQVDIDSE